MKKVMSLILIVVMVIGTGTTLFLVVENAAHVYQLKNSMGGSSIGRDIRTQLRNLYGDEYKCRLKMSETRDGQNFRVYEDMEFSVSAADDASVQKTLTVASIVSALFNLTPATVCVKAVCNMFGLAVSIDSLIPDDEQKHIKCGVVICRYVTVNETKYKYSTTFKRYDYDAYDSRDDNNDIGAKIDIESLIESESDGKEYFDSYNLQIEEAYKKFQEIGYR